MQRAQKLGFLQSQCAAKINKSNNKWRVFFYFWYVPVAIVKPVEMERSEKQGAVGVHATRLEGCTRASPNIGMHGPILGAI